MATKLPPHERRAATVRSVWELMRDCSCRCIGFAWTAEQLRIGVVFDEGGKPHHPACRDIGAAPTR